MQGDHRRGRFTIDENETLFSLILADPRIRSAFCHQQRTRNGKGESLIEDLTNRFNEKSIKPRSKDAIRHHLKLRRTTTGDQKKGGGSHSIKLLERLLKHHTNCEQKTGCTRCLMMQRLRVQLGVAKCDYHNCISCNSSNPAVQNPFNTNETLFKIHSMKYTNTKCLFEERTLKRKFEDLQNISSGNSLDIFNQNPWTSPAYKRQDSTLSMTISRILGDSKLKTPLFSSNYLKNYSAFLQAQLPIQTGFFGPFSTA